MSHYVEKTIKNYIDEIGLNNNIFYRKFRKNPLDQESLTFFCQQYYYYIRTFPRILAGLSGRVESEEVRMQLARTVVSELGDGHGVPHFRLFEKVLEAAEVQLVDFQSCDHMPEAEALVQGLRRLFLEDSTIAAVGGHYTIEETGLPMLHNLYEGFRNYSSIDVRAMEYFHLHLFLEADHVDWISKAVESLSEEPSNQDLLIRGGKEVADLLNQFWSGLNRQLPQKQTRGAMETA